MSPTACEPMGGGAAVICADRPVLDSMGVAPTEELRRKLMRKTDRDGEAWLLDAPQQEEEHDCCCGGGGNDYDNDDNINEDGNNK